MAAQVYGGSISFVVGAYLRSRSSQDFCYSAGITVVLGLSVVFNNNRISGSQAGTYAIGGGVLQYRNGGVVSVPHNHTFRMLERLGTSLIVLTRF